MKRLIIVFSIGAVICFCRISLAGDAVLGQKEWKLATYSSAKTATLNIELRRISDNATVLLSHMTFPITTTVNFGLNNPWVVADQYIKVMYDCNYPCWGIKIITDNQKDIGGLKPKPLGKGDDGKWEWEYHPEWNGYYAYINGEWETGDDWVSFGGLIRTGQVADNPTMRADLGWQIRIDWWSVGNVVGIKPVNPHDTPDFDFGTPSTSTDPNDEDDWKSNWAYIVDKSNKPYNNNIIIGWVKDSEGNTLAWYNYNVAIYGDGTGDFLAQHPPNMVDTDNDGKPDKVIDKPGDGDVAVYIAARFCSINYKKNPAGVPFVLPMGTYKTKIYIELSHE